MENFIVPYIDIASKDYVKSHNVNNIIGKIKDSINCEDLIKYNLVQKNEDFVKILTDSKDKFIPLPNYYDTNVKEFFDIYGGIYQINEDSIDFLVKIYFYKIKNVELLTKKIIEDFKLIFQYDCFVKNNILNMDWHSYRLSLFTKDIEQEKFLNLAFTTPEYCSSKLFHHQNNNISCMLDIYANPSIIPITDVTMHFENGLIYDFVKNQFIEEKEIPTYTIQGGMILDEPGTGKTLQFILFLLELKKKSLILVPNLAIKKVWTTEFKKHILIDFHHTPIEIMTYDEVIEFILVDNNALNNYEIIGIDEIHILYSNAKYNVLFKNIITSNIKSRWGITGTPFVNDISLFNIIKFLTGTNFINERIANIPSLQNSLIKLFLKNLKINMTNDYKWPEITIHDVFVELDIMQRKLYDTEAKTTFNKQNLRKIVSEVQLMFEHNDIRTPAELKSFAGNHYKKLYETELSKLDILNDKFKNIIKNKEKFSKDEYIKRVEHYEKTISTQEEIVKRYKGGYEFFMSSVNSIDNIFKKKNTVNDENEENEENDVNDENEDTCVICLGEFTPPIKYFKLCGHYFCGNCVEHLHSQDNTVKCPVCRKDNTKQDIITVQDVMEINDSPKLHEMHQIISKYSGKFIIFSQFNILEKFQTLLNKKGLKALTFEEYSITQEECKVLLLSSEKNAEGISLSMFDNLIIFEPFEDHVYCKEIEKQLIGRIHRISRMEPVEIFRLITKDTIEEEIYYS
jgi:SNF2 family DNA or RNA helicase